MTCGDERLGRRGWSRPRAAWARLIVLLGLLLAGIRPGCAAAPSDGRETAWPRGAAPDAHAAQGEGPSPLLFVENVGQFPGRPGPRFQAQGAGGGTIWLAEDAIWITLVGQPTAARGCGLGEEGQGSGQGIHLKLSFPGASPVPQIVPLGRTEIAISFLRGDDPASWHSRVPVWRGARYADLYPGIDLEIGMGSSPAAWDGLSPLSWRLVLHPGAPLQVLETVRLRVEGAQGLALEAQDTLVIATPLGRLVQPLPELVLAQAEGAREEWELGQPVLLGTDVLGAYRLPHAACALALMQPEDGLAYSTFLGGSGLDLGCAVALDPGDGSIVVSGVTYSPDFPTTPGAFDTDHNGGYDAFLSRLSADGSQLLSSTFLGGSGEDGSRAVAVDPSDGTLVVAGATRSADFPTTVGAFDTTHNGDFDAFVARLSTDGAALSHSTFLGGGQVDKGWGLAVNAADGSAVVVGRTRSPDFPATPGAFDPTYNADWDGFVTRLAADGAGLVYSTFLGGSEVDYGEAVALDPAYGTAVVAGGSFSADLPTTPGAYDPTHNGEGDAVVVRLSEDGSTLLYGTFLGGSAHDEGHAVAVDPLDGRAIVTGGAMSADFPTTPGALDSTFNGGVYDAFVAWVSSDGSSLLHSTFLGGEGADYGAAVTAEPAGGSVLVAGVTTSGAFPTAPGAFDPSYNGGGGDAFVSRLDAAGSSLTYSSYLGGEGTDRSWGLAWAAEAGGRAVVAGYTDSAGFPATPGGLDPLYNGGGDAFLTGVHLAAPAVHVSAISLWGRTLGSYFLVFSAVRIVDQDENPVGGAGVQALLTRPDGSTVARGAVTSADGRAWLWVAGPSGGLWTTCVEEVVAAGYLYDPAQNQETCDSLVFP